MRTVRPSERSVRPVVRQRRIDGDGDGSGLDDQAHLIDPTDFVGTRDRDTAFTVSVDLGRAPAADKQAEDLDHRLARNQPHVGDFDVLEAMAWIAEAVRTAGDPLTDRRSSR